MYDEEEFGESPEDYDDDDSMDVDEIAFMHGYREANDNEKEVEDEDKIL